MRICTFNMVDKKFIIVNVDIYNANTNHLKSIN